MRSEVAGEARQQCFLHSNLISLSCSLVGIKLLKDYGMQRICILAKNWRMTMNNVLIVLVLSNRKLRKPGSINGKERSKGVPAGETAVRLEKRRRSSSRMVNTLDELLFRIVALDGAGVIEGNGSATGRFWLQVCVWP